MKMLKQFFFDDQRLFVRLNAKREYGRAECVGTYCDPNMTPIFSWALKGTDGRIHLISTGNTKLPDGKFTGIQSAAISDDGIHFSPRNTAKESGFDNPTIPNQILPPWPLCTTEIIGVMADPVAPADMRYKLLLSDGSKVWEELKMVDRVYVSPDLIHWRLLEDSCWNQWGNEPVGGAFFNPVSGKTTILTRDVWEKRRVCVTETANWHDFTPLEHCLQCDSLDVPLAEIYGMPAFEYDGWFIGFPHIYSGFKQEIGTKYNGGTIHCQLAYSLNGRHWQRSLREPFLEGSMLPEAPWPLVFPSTVLRESSGSLLIYCTASHNVHGASAEQSWRKVETKILRLRQDGFIRLSTENKNEPGIVATADILLQQPKISFNLAADKATCAIYKFNTAGKTVLRSHEDCIPFSGDCTEWTPEWKNGTPDELAGELINIEIRFWNGSLYSISYDGVAMNETEAMRYEKFHVIPAHNGF